MSLLLKIESAHDPYDGCQYCSSDDTLKYKETSIEELLKELTEYDLQNLGLIRTDPKKGVTDIGKSTLKRYGWVHADSAKTRAEQKILEEKFFLVKPRSAKNRSDSISEIDLSDLPYHQISDLSEGAYIVQRVTSKSVMADTDYKKYQTLVRRKQEAVEKAKTTKQKRAEAVKLKEIEAAKKLLQEAGVAIVES